MLSSETHFPHESVELFNGQCLIRFHQEISADVIVQQLRGSNNNVGMYIKALFTTGLLQARQQRTTLVCDAIQQ